MADSILVTGICGFVGSSLTKRIRDEWPNARVIGIDNLSRAGSETNRDRLRALGVRVVHGDVRCASDFETLPACTWVIDAAALSSVLAGIDGRTSSRQLVEHNLQGTINVLEYARRTRAGVVLLSSSRVYSIPPLVALELAVDDEAFRPIADAAFPPGCSPRGIAEGASTGAPISLYGATKLASEALALEYGLAFGFRVIVNRCGVLAGETQFGTADQGIFSYWIRAYASRQPLEYTGFEQTGHQVRDVLHPDDLSALLFLQMRDPSVRTGIWNVGGGAAQAMSLAQLSRWCAATFGAHAVGRGPSARPYDLPWVVMDTSQATADFGWVPRISLPEILEEIAAHHRAHPQWGALSRGL